MFVHKVCLFKLESYFESFIHRWRHLWPSRYYYSKYLQVYSLIQYFETILKNIYKHGHYLMFEICYLILEVSDVLAGVCVVELTLDFSFLFLGKKFKIIIFYREYANYLEQLAIIYKINLMLTSKLTSTTFSSSIVPFAFFCKSTIKVSII